MAEHSPDAEFVAGMRVDHDGAQTHWAVDFHNFVGERITRSERQTQAAIDRAVAPLRNELARLRQKVDAEPSIDAALLGYVRAAVAAALDADAVACAAANKRFVSLLIVEALAPLKKNMAEFETVIRRLVRSDAERPR